MSHGKLNWSTKKKYIFLHFFFFNYYLGILKFIIISFFFLGQVIWSIISEWVSGYLLWHIHRGEPIHSLLMKTGYKWGLTVKLFCTSSSAHKKNHIWYIVSPGISLKVGSKLFIQFHSGVRIFENQLQLWFQKSRVVK